MVTVLALSYARIRTHRRTYPMVVYRTNKMKRLVIVGVAPSILFAEVARSEQHLTRGLAPWDLCKMTRANTVWRTLSINAAPPPEVGALNTLISSALPDPPGLIDLIRLPVLPPSS